MIGEDQLQERFRKIIDEEVEIHKKRATVEDRRVIPDTAGIPLQDPRHWLKIPNVICVFVDMKGSTKFSAAAQQTDTASAYRLFTSTAVRLFDEFGAPDIDIKGDGAFALFDKGEHYRALAAAVTFKTFAQQVFVPAIKEKTGLEVGSHLGIDQKVVLVRRLGFKRVEGRTDRQNEVWAGKPVNMAAKLSSTSADNELLVSDRFYKRLKHEKATHSCGCGKAGGGKKEPLWTKVALTDDKFDFKTAYSLTPNWCPKHGKEYCESLLRAEDDDR